MTSANGTSTNAQKSEDTTNTTDNTTKTTNTDSSSSISGGESKYKNKQAALIAMTENVRKLYTFSLKLPGEFDDLHTNSFCMLMTSDKFKAENMPNIGRKLNGKFIRYLGFEENRYYIEGVTVSYTQNGGLTTELKLNPFASGYSAYAKKQMEAYNALLSALNPGTGSAGNANGTDCSNDTTRTLKISTYSTTPSAKNLAVIGNSSANYAQVAASCSTPQQALKMVHDRWHYLKYSDNQNPSGTLKGCPQYAFSQSTIRLNCADSAWLMKCIFDCMGLQNFIIHVPNHYYNKVMYNGRYYGADLCYWKSSHNELSKMV